MSWRREPATLKQRGYLVQLGVRPPRTLTKGIADNLIKRAKARQREALYRRGLF